MKHLSRDEFDARFSRRPPTAVFDGMYTQDLYIKEDAVLSGAVESPANVFVTSGCHVLVTGRIDGPVQVSKDAVVWNQGLLDGGIFIEGAAFLLGNERARGLREAIVYDPTEPADSITG